MKSSYLTNEFAKVEDAVAELKKLVNEIEESEKIYTAFYIGFLSGITQQLLLTLQNMLTNARKISGKEQVENVRIASKGA